MSDMTEYPADRWRATWDAIDARRQQLRMSLADLYRATGASEGTYRKMRIDGVGVKRSNKRHAICDGLKWTPDSIDRILAGGDPVTTDESPAGLPTLSPDANVVLERLSALGALLGDLEASNALLDRRIAELEDRVLEIEEAQPGNEQSSRR